MKQVLWIVGALGLTACAASNVRAAIADKRAVSLGQHAHVGQLLITPKTVIEDSRCPINARCVWAGRLVLETRIEGRKWLETANLTLGVPYVTHGTGVALVSAEPAKVAGRHAYRATRFAFEVR